ncbi:MAG: aldehyde dehydrogenase family protein, partial [Acidobacteria bacterium]|nr:aldehyde dehydrogenase family protein [Acidobacteriota bacterium]
MSSVTREVRNQNYIGGQWVDAASSRTFSVRNPATGELLGMVADAGREDATRAVEAAHGAFAGWAAMAAPDRAKLLL